MSPFSRILLSGSATSAMTSAALAVLARLQGRSALQPLNSTSHWYFGEAAGRSRKLDIRHTLVGFATHHAASVFWAAIFDAVRRAGPRRSVMVDAIGVSALAAFVDYAIVPKRLTPGWEKVVSPLAIGVAYGAMAFALAACCPRLEPAAEEAP